MEISSPKEMISNVIGSSSEDTKGAFKLKSKSTVNGMFFGGGGGLLIAHRTNKNLYVGTFIGICLGGLISNMLTVKKW